MEQERCEEITQVTVQTQQLALGDGFASPTPTKSTRSFDEETGLPVRTVILFSQEYQVCYDSSDSESEFPEDITEQAIMHAKTKVEIPDKHKPLAKLFDHLSARISMLNLFHMDPTFQNICTEVELLTLSHLAQMKFLLPEAIHIEKINARVLKPPKAICLMPDLKITLSLDVVQADPNRPAFMDLRRAFYQSLVEFSNSNSESCEIPEAELPWPFSQKDHTLLPKPLPVNSSIESHPTPIEYESVVSSPLYGHSFKRCFSREIVSETETEKRVSDLSSCDMSVEYTDSNHQTAETKSILADDNHQKSGFSQGYRKLCAI